MNPTPEELKELDEAFFSELLTNPVDLLSWTGPFVHWETGIDLGSPNEPSASFVMKVLLGSNPKLSNKYLSIF